MSPVRKPFSLSAVFLSEAGVEILSAWDVSSGRVWVWGTFS
jgi:hypothetical protein